MSFFYADIKTDELKVHGHTNNTPGQIEFLDADSQKMVTLKAPSIIESNVTIILPSSNGTANNILTSTDNNGTLSFVSASGDLTLGANGAFTVNGISNTSTIQSTANIVLAGTNSLYFADSNARIHAPDNGNLAISATSNIILEKGSDQMVFDIGQTNTYINFSNVVGDSGYGIKSNNGVMQYKSISESWSNIGSDTLAGLTDVALSSLANTNILVYNTSDSKWHNEAITSGYYGSFYDTTTQTNNKAISYNVMRLNSTDEAYGVSIQNNSQVVVAHSAVYNIQFSAQLDKTDSGTDIVNIWLLKNGTNVSNSDTELSLVGNAGKLVAAWNFLLSLATNDYIELAWKSDDANLRLFAQSNIAFAPGIPSVILTIHQVAYTLGGSSGYFMDLFDVNTTGKTGNSLVQYNVSTSKWDAVSNLTLNNGNYIKLGTTGNISGTNGGNVTVNASNVDIIVSGEAHVHNNMRVTGNIFFDGNNLSNITAPVGGNLNISASNVNILSTTETKLTGPVRLANTLYFDGGYLANISSPSAGNLVINAGNLDIIPAGHLNILGNAHIPYSNSRLAFGDQTTYIQSPATGNLDIRATAGNVNITANHDVVITTNSASTIRMVGPNGSSPVNISFAGSCSYINFGSTTGESGTGIKYNGTNVAVGSSGSWSGISNTTLNIAGRTVSLGGSNTVGFSDLTGTATNSQLANSTITVGGKTVSLGDSTTLELANISDIALTSVQNGNTLAYNSATSKWVNTNGSVFSGGITVNGLINGVTTPSSSNQAANKDYVDTVAQGLTLKVSARAATTANINIGTALVNGQQIDSVTLVTGNRVLVKNQTNGIENGIYSVLAAAGTPVRTSDFAAGSAAAGVFCFIQEGTNNSDCGFVCTNNSGSDIIGTNSLTFVQFSSAGVIQAGTALEKVGTTLNVLRTSILPIGCIQQYAGSTAPSGWVLCDGSSLSNVTYADLRTVIGGTYGSGTGTFTVPNLQGRIPVGRHSSDVQFDTLGETGGEKTVTLTTANIPAHQHFVAANESITSGSPWDTQPASSTNAIIHNVRSSTSSPNYTLVRTTTSSTQPTLGFSSNTGGGGAHNNLQPYIVLNYIIYTGVYT
jgi:microcystin-dependent protein